MTAYRKLSRSFAAAVMVALTLGGFSATTVFADSGTPAATATGTASALARIQIDNFGKVDDQYYRGAQPDGRDYADLAALGVKTVIDLTRDGRSNERAIVERTGMTFYRIPMSTSERPADGAVKQFLSIVNDPEKQPVYVHCQGGQHRTGVMTAVYRMTKYGWTETKAYDEMKQYKFETFFGHPELRRFVHDYYARLTPVASPIIATAALPALNAVRPQAD